jgi:hypothetical protein
MDIIEAAILRGIVLHKNEGADYIIPWRGEQDDIDWPLLKTFK